MAAYNCRWFKSSGGTLPVNHKGVERVFCWVFQGVQMLWESELGEAWMILCCKKWEKDGAELLKISCPEVSQLAPENRPNPKKEKKSASLWNQLSEANFVKFRGWEISLKFDIDTKNSHDICSKTLFWGIHVSFSWLFMLWIALMWIVFYCTFWGRHVLVGKVS